jgi:Na+/melibiose symporter-like transporter
MIFAIEGIITICLSLVAFFTLTDRPATAKWLTEEEKALAIARVKSERVGTTEVLDKIDNAKILKGIFSPVTLGTSMIFLLNNITVQGLAFFAPTIVSTIYPGRSIIFLQLHTVPPYIVGSFFTLLIPFFSWRYDRRAIFFIASAPFVIIGYIIFLASQDAHARYAATFLIATGAFSFGALCNAQVAANVVSDTARSSAIGTNVMFGNIGGLIATWSFLPFDGPNYRIGNGLNLATSSSILMLSIALLLWMKASNKRREASEGSGSELDGLSTKQIQDLDWKHPMFRWKL